VFGLFALAAIEACGSRSPLLSDFEGVAGDGETGGSGGSLGGAGGVTTGGYGGKAMSVGGAYPMGVGGAVPAAGFGGKGGSGGKGMGTGGKGGGKGDPGVYKGCLLACEKFENFCAGENSSCLDDCVAAGALYPQCAGVLTDWLFCLQEEFNPLRECNPVDCSGPGCMNEAQAACESVQQELVTCMSGGTNCSWTGEFSETTCRVQAYCSPVSYDTYCLALDAEATTFSCNCTEGNSTGVTVLSNQTVHDACYAMNTLCGFPEFR
jgi:hypothetical protein